MLRFIKLAAILIYLKFTAVFFAITMLPLISAFLYKRYKRKSKLSSAVYLLEQCLQHSVSLHSKQCHEITNYIREIITSLTTLCHFPRETAAEPYKNSSVSPAQALDLFPLLYEISQPDSCCETIFQEISKLPRNIECKSTIQAFIAKAKQADDPLITEELSKAEALRRKFKKVRKRNKILLFIFFPLYCIASLIITRGIVFNAENWETGVVIYLISFAVLVSSQNFSYFRISQKYRKKHH